MNNKNPTSNNGSLWTRNGWLTTVMVLAATAAATASGDLPRDGARPYPAWTYSTVAMDETGAPDHEDDGEQATTGEDDPALEPDEQQPVRRYITREEKLEAGERRRITDWLYTTTLAEYEWESERLSGNAGSQTDRSSVLTLQGGLELIPTDHVQAELILEYDSEVDRTIIDELVGVAQWEPFEIEVGKQGLPFGEYFSRFETGPLIEFGETTETAVKLSYGLEDLGDLSLTGYEGRANSASGGSDLDYVAALELEPGERLALGVSYLSDLADSDERLLSDNGDLFTGKVPALSGYAFWIGDHYELSLEYVGALETFRELDGAINKPTAWNIELGLFVIENLDLAFRLEGSGELEDAPQRRVGVAATVLLHERATLTLEMLHGRFRNDFVTDDEDNPFDDVTTLGILFSMTL